jgi:hypothetical protein
MASVRLRHDKLSEIFSIRIPAVTKMQLDKLSSAYRTKLNERVMISIAQILHEASFDPSFYLVENYPNGEDDAT